MSSHTCKPQRMESSPPDHISTLDSLPDLYDLKSTSSDLTSLLSSTEDSHSRNNSSITSSSSGEIATTEDVPMRVREKRVGIIIEE
ncbi:hypothetical protein M5689_022504 [Euphorbia peplus]|nr:hypothetical protein M5689_022504 [Euphorbia peplus]